MQAGLSPQRVHGKQHHERPPHGEGACLAVQHSDGLSQTTSGNLSQLNTGV